ncbi:GTP cyclohydrolase I FolE [Tepidibacillus infernus]|uniref:GTP cyclohydrolase 1 n=1 Tax=Tepidibacillus decaturensis TaxID=1413211 RepID=A0A135L401_9BACI|nr:MULTISPECIES: GTP cyclohydrolase I FolE [Tepidibacillus]KXG43641.1 GTP cyclohydrolase I [Tepidibacillus decaturensis]GBF11695.1 GTP cyclohydrolase 1 [Tepidibacillus sp. HK-1]
MGVNHKQIEEAVKVILKSIGEDPEREGLLETPARVARMYEEIFVGLEQDPKDYFDVIFSEKHEEVVLVKDIPFYSTCEHHLVPFFGIAHVAYIPRDGRVTGLSKLARAVEAVAKRPQLQERMTDTIADAIMEKLEPFGVLVMIEAEHMCMTMRGVKKPGSKTVTITARGIYKEDPQLRNEILQLIRS